MRPSRRNEAASVGPPSRRSDCTPSAARAASSSARGPLRSSSSDPSGSGPRPNARRRGWPVAPTPRAVKSGRVGAHRAHADGHRVDAGPQLVHEPAGRLAGDPARARHGRASIEGDGSLVRHERPPLCDPDAEGLVLHPRPPLQLAAGRTTSSPAERRRAKPSPSTSGLGSPAAATTAATPDATTASAHGGTAPWCEHGSSET